MYKTNSRNYKTFMFEYFKALETCTRSPEFECKYIQLLSYYEFPDMHYKPFFAKLEFFAKCNPKMLKTLLSES